MTDTATGTGVPEIDRTIYPMPLFPTLPVADLAVAQSFYEALGFVALATVPGPGGTPVVVHLRRMRYQDILLVPGEPRPGSATVSVSAGGEDLDERAGRLRAAFPDARVEGPLDTPWFTSDLRVRDPDGYDLVITAPREAEMAQAREWAATFEGDYVVEDAPDR